MTDGEADELVTRRGFLLGSAGVAAAGAAGTAAAQDGTTTSGGTTTGGEGTTTGGGNGTSGGEGTTTSGEGGGGGGGSETVTVGPGGELVFEPAELQISPGTTVEWVWESDTHNVIPTSQPDGAGWEGSGSESETFDTGHTYSHTFDTEGSYEYVCIPHESAGMAGTITVGGSEGGGESAGPAIPESAKTLGVATSGAMVFTLGLAYFFMKFGGDYGEFDE
ncbi:plastocyanin/azurin family copper-binding protein [Haladaptatus pallidirubidus]|uniref:Blue (type 1) copper domain-containing protein n=1 Tax=Haladaptatus pallidirubidus TaxID=1008152 RepID=A0AAV3UB15_9EURY|nr:plastocyanin/azurin family copper-binding protein [Haladaptatus pallidirubidus]